MKRFSIKDIFILIVLIATLLLPAIFTEIQVLQQTKDVVIYPENDAFINMTVAKNLAFYKVWGISKESFDSVSVTPLYVIILAVVYFIFGQYLIIPLLVNGVLAILFITVAKRYLEKRHFSAFAQWILLTLVIFCGSLPSLIMSGKEYMLQVFFTFLFISSFIESLSECRKPLGVYLFGALTVLSGYDCCVLAVVACATLFWQRQWQAVAFLAAASFLPLILFGITSVTKGGYFLPNQLLIPTTRSILTLAFIVVNAILFGGVILHKYRNILHTGRNVIKWSMTLILLLLATPIFLYSAGCLKDTSEGCFEVYRNEYPVAKFIHRYFKRGAIAVNDAGMISYWFLGRSVDLTGRTDKDALACRRMNLWSSSVIDSLSRNSATRMAILSNNCSKLPGKWSRVASWEIPKNNTQFNTIDFYIVDTTITHYLKKNLLEFRPSLPVGTIVHYF